MSPGSRKFGKFHASVRAKNNKRKNPFLYPDVSPERWQEQANCQGKAFEMFEYQEKDSPLVLDMSFKERLEFNEANFQLASEVCIECPVFFKCGEDATEDEKFWTVRQGEPPGRFAQERAQHEHLITTGKPASTVCARGHEKPMGKRCPTCKKATNERYRQRLQALNDRLARDAV